MTSKGTEGTKEESDEGSPIGNLLGGSWELAQKILENLSYNEVSKQRLVCQTWADVGEMILAKRRPLHYLTVHPHCIPTTHGKVAIAESPPATLFERFFLHIVSKPRYCLAFCSADWISRMDIFTHTEKQVPISLLDYLHKSLPSTCEYAVISASGIVGTVETSYQGHSLESAQTINNEILNFLREDKDKPQSKPPPPEHVQKKRRTEEPTDAQKAKEMSGVRKSNVGYSIEVEKDTPAMLDADAVSLLVIPHHPGVNIKFFEISPTKFDFGGFKIPNSKLLISEEDFNEMISLPRSQSLVSLLLFDTCDDDTFTSEFIKTALHRENYQLALGGGVADYFYSSHSKKVVPMSNQIFGIAVSGPNVMAASVLIPESVNNPRNVGRYMQKLKSCGFPEKQSLAFMFSCCGRGYNSWQQIPNYSLENVESKAFRKLFPNTPIFGFFGQGEIGINYLPSFPKTPGNVEGVPQWTKRKACHQYSTVIVLLSFL